MQISGLRDTQLMTQPGVMRGHGMEGQKLVFLYPILAYDGISPNLLNSIRDFLTVNFVSQIREANMFNITVDAIRNVGTIGPPNNSINPAELVRNSLSNISNLNHRSVDSWTAGEHRHLYQERITNFYNFIRNQILHDPRYLKLRPVISNISSENLLQIPLVLGTKHYSINPIILYHILLISASFNIPIKSSNNISAIFNILEQIPPENYINLIFDETYRTNLLTRIGITRATDPSFINTPGSSFSDIQHTRAINPIYTRLFGRLVYELNNQERHKFLAIMQSDMQKARIFFDLVLNPNRWSVESNGLETRRDLTLNTISINDNISTKYYSSAINSFSNYLRSIIVPMFNDIELIFGPTPPEIYVSVKIEAFLNDIFTNMQTDFQQLGQSIIAYIRNQATITDTIKKNIKSILDICEENAKMTEDIKKAFDKLDNVSNISPGFSTHNLESFLNQINITSRMLTSHEKVIDSWFNLMTVVGGHANLTDLIRRIKNQIAALVSALFHQVYPNGVVGNSPWIDLPTPNVYERFPTFAANFGPTLNTPIVAGGVGGIGGIALRDPITQQILYLPPTEAQQTQVRNIATTIFRDIEHGIVQIIIFLLKWNFFSYICDYIKEVDVDIDIQQRDALEFPNYCLVIPLEIFYGLQNALSIRHFSDILQDVRGVVNNINDLNFTKQPTDINRMVNYLCTRLGIPNIILVDNAAKKIHYKFMYMTKTINLTYSTVDQYISHQKEILILP
jgi:hypothetical protein